MIAQPGLQANFNSVDMKQEATAAPQKHCQQAVDHWHMHALHAVFEYPGNSPT